MARKEMALQAMQTFEKLYFTPFSTCRRGGGGSISCACSTDYGVSRLLLSSCVKRVPTWLPNSSIPTTCRCYSWGLR
jgi:hypothetical protein